MITINVKSLHSNVFRQNQKLHHITF